MWHRSDSQLQKTSEFVMNAIRYFDLNIEQILEGWEVRHALREIVANALDEQILSTTANVEIECDAGQSWHIRDWGRGIRYEHLTQNENKEKLDQQGKVIGKFGVGLKDALATLNRHGIDVCILSRHCEIKLEQTAKHGFTEVITLHAVVKPPSNPEFVGTDVQITGVSAEQIQAAKNFFLKFGNEKVLDYTPYGQILSRDPSRNARIYVAGILVAEEERLAFSYNITSLTAQMRKALNRERTNVGRTAYTDRVKSMLLASTAPSVASVLAEDLTRMQQGTNHDEVRWTDVALHASKILNSSRRVVFVTASELTTNRDSIDSATAEGYQIVTIPDNLSGQVSDLEDSDGRPLRNLAVFEQELAESYEFKFVNPHDLGDSERKVYENLSQIVAISGGLPPIVKELRISEQMGTGIGVARDTLGLWEPARNRIIIKRSQLASLSGFAGTLLHEIAHARSGADDVSRAFEWALTELLGSITERHLQAAKDAVPMRGSIWSRLATGNRAW